MRALSASPSTTRVTTKARSPKPCATRYGLSEVRVTASPANGDIHTLRQNIGAAGARLLEALVRDGDSIGVEWSNSIHAMAQALQPQLRRGIEIVQLRGSETKARQGLNEAEPST